MHGCKWRQDAHRLYLLWHSAPADLVTCLNCEHSGDDPVCMAASLQRLADHAHMIEASFVAQLKNFSMMLAVCLLHDAHMGS